MDLCRLSCEGICWNIVEPHYNKIYKLCNVLEHALQIYISGIKRDFKSCVMKDSSRYCFPDRCSGLRGVEEDLHSAPNVREMD